MRTYDFIWSPYIIRKDLGKISFYARLNLKTGKVVDPGNNWKQGESRKVRSMRDEQIEEKIGEGGGNRSGYARGKTGEDGTKVKIDIKRVDRIYILQK